MFEAVPLLLKINNIYTAYETITTFFIIMLQHGWHARRDYRAYLAR